MTHLKFRRMNFQFWLGQNLTHKLNCFLPPRLVLKSFFKRKHLWRAYCRRSITHFLNTQTLYNSTWHLTATLPCDPRRSHPRTRVRFDKNTTANFWSQKFDLFSIFFGERDDDHKITAQAKRSYRRRPHRRRASQDPSVLPCARGKLRHPCWEDTRHWQSEGFGSWIGPEPCWRHDSKKTTKHEMCAKYFLLAKRVFGTYLLFGRRATKFTSKTESN